MTPTPSPSPDLRPTGRTRPAPGAGRRLDRHAPRRRPAHGSRIPRTALLLTTLIPLAAGGCRDEPPPALEVADVEYAREDLLGLAPERKLLLGEITALGLAVATGEAAELAHPLVEREERLWLARGLRAEEVLDSAGIEEDVLRAHYRTDPALELTVRHLIVLSGRYETEAVRQEARRKAVRALERIRAGEAFPQVAAEVSEEPGAEGRQGLLEPGREGAWVDEFWSAAASLDPGQISGVVETQYGFHVLRLEGKDTVPFQDVRPDVALDVARLMRASLDPSHLELPEVRLDEAALAAFTIPGDASWATGSVGSAGGIRAGEHEPAESGTGAGATPADGIVARWDGGGLTAGQLRVHLAALPRERWKAALSDTTAALGEAREAARLHIAAARMRDRGVTPPEAVGAEVRRAWEEQITRWSSAFGFREGMAAEALRAAALEALGARGQGPTLAREEVRERGPILHLRYPIRVLETQDGGNP